jgi:hypothetical protein
MKARYIILFLFSCKGTQTEKIPDICFADNFNQKVEWVSLKNVEDIKRLDGKFIQLDGILHYEFEDVALYPSKYSDITEAIWLDLRIPDTIPKSQLEKLNNRKITVIGRVNISSKGHYNAYIATLDSTFCVKIK